MARLILLLFFFFGIWVALPAQVDLLRKVHDFGLLRRADANWADFELQNKTSETVHIFRVECPSNVDVKFSSKALKPGESAIIRVAYSPSAEGKFEEELTLHVSAWNAPRKISIRGESTFAANGLIPCPDFNQAGGSSNSDFYVTARSWENIPIAGAEVRVYQNGRYLETVRTDKNGEALIHPQNGRVFISVKSGSSIRDTAFYVNPANDHLLAILDAALLDPKNVVMAEEVAEVIEGEEPTSVVPGSQPEEAPPTDPSLDSKSLPLSQYKVNNLVFLVDKSSSMKANGKMDLLKVSMIELLEILRPDDRFTLISYATGTEVIIKSEGDLDRQACIEAILALEAGGSTAGAKAIDKAGKVAVDHFVDGGNNQVILATDGSFSQGVDPALKIARKYVNKGVVISVLGIKCGKFAESQMLELTQEGNGRYVPLRDVADAGKELIEEVKLSSVRN